MKLTRQHKIIIVIVVILLIAAGISFYGYKNKQKLQEEMDEVYRIIKKGVGAMGIDLKTILDKVQPDTRNAKRLMDSVKAIYKAFFWEDIFGSVHRNVDDDEDAVRNTFKKMTKGEVKAMLPVFAKEYGISLDEFLSKYNNEEELKTYYTTVSNLK